MSVAGVVAAAVLDPDAVGVGCVPWSPATGAELPEPVELPVGAAAAI